MTVIERLYGRKFPALVAQSGTISERTLRSWLDGTSIPDERRQDEFAQRNAVWLRSHLTKLEWSQELRDAYFAEVAANTGPASALVHIVHWRGGRGCPATLELARRIDTLSAAMAQQRKADDLDAFIGLFHTEWLTDHHFNNPDYDLSPAALRASTAQASVWGDLTMPTAVVLFNLQLQLLATLDHEFRARYLPTFAPVPVFHGLFPDRVPGKEGTPRTRGSVRLPVRRLLHMVACMRYFRRHGRWPVKAPSVENTAKWMNVLPNDLARWRMGRRFTLDDFDTVWERMFEDYPESTRPGAPIPLMLAAVLLTRMLVLGSRERHDLSVAHGGAALYLGWWERQRATAEEYVGAPSSGTEMWMPGLL